jgi:hypothetical protein
MMVALRAMELAQQQQSLAEERLDRSNRLLRQLEEAGLKEATEEEQVEAVLREQRSSRVRTNTLKICRCELCRPGKYVTLNTFFSHHASVMGEVGPQQAERMAADDTELGRVLLAAQARIIDDLDSRS